MHIIVVGVGSNSKEGASDCTIGLLGLLPALDLRLDLLGVAIVVKDHAINLIPYLQVVDHRALGRRIESHVVHSLVVPISVVLRRHIALVAWRHRHLAVRGVHAVTQNLRIMKQCLVLLKKILLHIYLSLNLCLDVLYRKVLRINALVWIKILLPVIAKLPRVVPIIVEVAEAALLLGTFQICVVIIIHIPLSRVACLRGERLVATLKLLVRIHIPMMWSAMLHLEWRYGVVSSRCTLCIQSRVIIVWITL